MSLVTLRQIFKACAEDTRLRILSLLSGNDLTVKEICAYLGISQPTISKHLARLRILKIVLDKRKGNLVYYALNRNLDSPQVKIINFIVSQFQGVDTFRKDKEALHKEKDGSGPSLSPDKPPVKDNQDKEGEI